MAKQDNKDAVRVAWIMATNGSDWPFVPEYQFHDSRRWRFDWAHPAKKLAVEIEGVVYGGHGRHQTAVGLGKDCEKYNAAAELGWTVLRYTPQMIREDPIGVVEQILNVAAR